MSRVQMILGGGGAARVMARRRRVLDGEVPTWGGGFEPSLNNRILSINDVTPGLCWAADGTGNFTANAGPTPVRINGYNGSSGTPINYPWHPFHGGGNATYFPTAPQVFQESTATKIVGTDVHVAYHVVASSKGPYGPGGNHMYLCSDNAVNQKRIRVYHNSYGQFIAVAGDGVTAKAVSLSSVVAGSWLDIWLFLHRASGVVGNSMIMYINTVASNTADFSGVTGELDGEGEWTLGDYSNLSGWTIYEEAVALAEVFSGDLGWPLSGYTTNYEAIVAESIQRLSGGRPVFGNDLDYTTLERASAKHLWIDDGTTTRFVQVGVNWTDNCRVDADGTLVSTIRCENTADNYIPYSENFSQWTAADGTDTLTSDYERAVHGRYNDAFIASTTDGDHRRYISVAMPANGLIWTVVTKKDKNWATIGTDAANSDAFFNLSTGVVGSKGSSISASGIVSLGSSRYLIWAKTSLGAATRNVYAGPAHADNDYTFAGDGSTISIAMDCAQCSAEDRPSSYIATNGASVTRARDDIEYPGAGNYPSAWRITFDVVNQVPSDSYAVATLVHINDGGAATEWITIYRNGSGQVVVNVVDATVSQATVTGTTDIRDGKKHAVEVIVKTDNVQLKVDGVSEGTPATSATLPTDIDRHYLGDDYNGGNAGDQLHVSNVRFYEAA